MDKNVLTQNVAAPENTRYAINGVAIEGNRIVSTDGRRLLRVTVEGMDVDGGPVIVSAENIKAIKALGKHVDLQRNDQASTSGVGADERIEVSIATDDNLNSVRRLSLPIMAGAKFPEYQGSIPEYPPGSQLHTVMVDPKLLGDLLIKIAKMGVGAVTMTWPDQAKSSSKAVGILVESMRHATPEDLQVTAVMAPLVSDGGNGAD